MDVGGFLPILVICRIAEEAISCRTLQGSLFFTLDGCDFALGLMRKNAFLNFVGVKEAFGACIEVGQFLMEQAKWVH